MQEIKLTPFLIEETSKNPSIDQRGILQIIGISKNGNPILSDGQNYVDFELSLRCKKQFFNQYQQFDVISAKIYCNSDLEFCLNDFVFKIHKNGQIGSPIKCNFIKNLENQPKNEENTKINHFSEDENENYENIKIGRREKMFQNNEKDKFVTIIGKIMEKNVLKNNNTQFDEDFYDYAFKVETDDGSKCIKFFQQSDLSQYENKKFNVSFKFEKCLEKKGYLDGSFSKISLINKSDDIDFYLHSLAQNSELRSNYFLTLLSGIHKMTFIENILEGKLLNEKVSILAKVDHISPMRFVGKDKSKCLIKVKVFDKTGFIDLAFWEKSEKTDMLKKNNIYGFLNLKVGLFCETECLNFSNYSLISEQVQNNRFYDELLNFKLESFNFQENKQKSQNDKKKAFVDILSHQEFLNFYEKYLLDEKGTFKTVVFRSKISITSDNFYYDGCNNCSSQKKIFKNISGQYSCSVCHAKDGSSSPRCKILIGVPLKNGVLNMTSFDEKNFEEIFDIPFKGVYNNCLMNETENGVNLFSLMREKGIDNVFEIQLILEKDVIGYTNSNKVIRSIRKIRSNDD